MIYGAVLAGGIGKRMEKYSIPKQFITIGGVPIIIRSMRTMLKNERLDVIYVAVHKDWILYAEKLFKEYFLSEELLRIRIVPGGKERLDSFVNIMNDIIDRTGILDDDILICHDSVRPFVTNQMIEDCIDATIKYGLALTVIPVTDTIHKLDDDELIDGTLDRNKLYNGQTPSGFNLKILKNAIDTTDDETKKSITGTTQLMLKLGYKISPVKGHVSNLKITTDNDIEISEKIIRSSYEKNKVKLLDCTLRDGGIVIDFNFGIDRMTSIKKSLEESGVEYIECGYIDQGKGSSTDRTCFDNEVSIEKTLLKSGKVNGTTYVAMIDYGKFDLDRLNSRTEDGIDGIRYAFHKENWKDAVKEARKIIDKGYDLFIQPMVSIRYSDDEFKQLISACNKELPEAKGFYIVDSFGQMDGLTLLHKLEIADQFVSDNMIIGLHAHNNRQMAFSNACTMIKTPCKHQLMLDASIMGMGKGAGNLCTELIIPVLLAEGNEYYPNVIYDEINAYFSNALRETPWGYCLDYYLSSLYGCTPSYIKIFVADSRVSTDDLVDLLKGMPEEKKAACDKKFASEYLERYYEERV